MADFGLSGAYAAQNLQGLLRQRLADRIAQQERDRHALESDRAFGLQQQQFQSNEELKRAQLEALTQNRQATEADRKFGIAQHLGDTLPADTFVPQQDPAVGMMQTGGTGSLLNPTPATEPMGPNFTGPMPNGETPQQAQVGRPAGFIKTASAKQQEAADKTKEMAARDEALQGYRNDITDIKRQVADRGGTTPTAIQEFEYAKKNGFPGSFVDYQKQLANMKTPSPAAANNELDRSYQYHRSALDKLSTPVDTQLERISKLHESITEGTPQADALVAPQLLSMMAGGSGSGLRMNEAEIARIIGGRSAFENLKATMQHWSTDPKTANSITPEQRAQMQRLITAVQQRTQAKADVLNQAGDALVSAGSVLTHRQTLANARRALQGLDVAGAATPAASTGGLVKMLAPDGRPLSVPSEKVAELEALGAKRVP